MAGAVKKWRPTLGMIIITVLLTVMALPLAGLFFFRLYENQLIRQTESELIAQTSVLAAVFASEVERQPDLLAALKAVPLPPKGEALRGPVETFHPIEPVLDLAGDDVLGQRPDAREALAAPDPAIADIGARVYRLALKTQDVTLAGFRILDANGIVLAGHEETGRSLAHVEEVASALRGKYGSALRFRQSSSPPPALYSMSRGTGVRVFVAMPVLAGPVLAGVIYASRTPSNVFRHLYGERRKLALAGLAILGATLLIGFVLSRTITRPIHGLIEQTRRIGAEESGQKGQGRHFGTREIAALSDSFASMEARLAERSTYIRTFAAHVSHELKSPLTSIQGAAELMREHLPGQAPMSEGQRARFLDNIIADTRRLTLLLDRLRELARADNPQTHGRTSVAAVLEGLAFPALEVVVAGETQRMFAMSPENATIVFSHLLDNAQRHHAGCVELKVAARDGLLVINFGDDGDGISPANRSRIFDAFFTTRRESGGTGMGLGIVRSLLQAHGGGIELVPSQAGARFRMVVPLVGKGT